MILFVTNGTRRGSISLKDVHHSVCAMIFTFQTSSRVQVRVESVEAVDIKDNIVTS